MLTLSEFCFSQKDVIDITDFVQQHIGKNGICTVVVKDTQSAIILSSTYTETDADICTDMERAFPARCSYASSVDPLITSSTIISSVIGTRVDIPYREGKLLLGKRQSIRLVFLGKNRNVCVAVYLMEENKK